MAEKYRAVVLAEKLALPENAALRARVPVWLKDSEAWAETMMRTYGPNKTQTTIEGYRLLYILNHLCPSLYHFHREPDPRRFRGDIAGFNKASREHFLENTQASLSDDKGILIQDGVHYTKEEFAAFHEVLRQYLP